jgi:nickel-dependent lactate racemase
MDVIGTGHRERLLNIEEIDAICRAALERIPLDGTRTLFVMPDLTRTCPLDLLFPILYREAANRLEQVDIMIALGTHDPLTEEEQCHRVGITPETRARDYPKTRFFNHCWDDPSSLTRVGRYAAKEIEALTEGLFALDIDVTVNRVVEEYDHLVIVGPVFPHEVVGFSGGNKYLFPGISGPEVLHFFHWLGAVITNPRIIGMKDTPVRAVIDRAAAMVPLERHALCMVVKEDGLAGLYAGAPESAWSAAADLSHDLHIVSTPRAYHTVLSCAQQKYKDLWVGGKCMYKLEPTIADGGTLIIYGPHIDRVSNEHGEHLLEIGYHVRDYFQKQWDRFRHVPWGILAHSTHVKGIGRYDRGVESPRVDVVLATGIPESECRRINLGYMDPASIRMEEYQGREQEGVFCVPHAGEVLYRWKDAPAELGGAGEPRRPTSKTQ